MAVEVKGLRLPGFFVQIQGQDRYHILALYAGFPHLRTFAGMSFIGTAAGVLVHVITSQEEEQSKIELLKKSTANVAKELS